MSGEEVVKRQETLADISVPVLFAAECRDEDGLDNMNLLVMHHPPYCSKYNPIEHRLFSQITRNWSGAPLLSLEDAAKRAAETTTSKGLTVYVDINDKTYDIQRSIDESYDDTLKKRVVFQTVLSKWNYLVKRS